MATEGYQTTTGEYKKEAYNDFELKKFRFIAKDLLINNNIETVLDYGGGGSNWDSPNFDSETGKSAIEYFNLKSVETFEPARNKNPKIKSDCVVCMDVLEHIFLSDIPIIINELFTLSNKLVLCNVACYDAAALLPNGENAHITVRHPIWWKGVFDSILMDYHNIKLILICSTGYLKGIMFGPYTSNDWNKSSKFKIPETPYVTFGSK